MTKKTFLKVGEVETVTKGGKVTFAYAEVKVASLPIGFAKLTTNDVTKEKYKQFAVKFSLTEAQRKLAIDTLKPVVAKVASEAGFKLTDGDISKLLREKLKENTHEEGMFEMALSDYMQPYGATANEVVTIPVVVPGPNPGDKPLPLDNPRPAKGSKGSATFDLYLKASDGGPRLNFRLKGLLLTEYIAYQGGANSEEQLESYTDFSDLDSDY